MVEVPQNQYGFTYRILRFISYLMLRGITAQFFSCLGAYIFINHREMVGGSGPPVAFLVPKGDRGLFGPESIAWKVHADFISMMIGGISSLILQALHPQALAGVWDHSSFREDLKGRLGRTAFFIAATTYGPTEMANNIIQKVNQIHTKVTGLALNLSPWECGSRWITPL